MGQAEVQCNQTMKAYPDEFQGHVRLSREHGRQDGSQPVEDEGVLGCDELLKELLLLLFHRHEG